MAEVYDERGVSNSLNVPSARYGAQMLAATNGHLWLMGGRDEGHSKADVWSFDPFRGWWTFEAGRTDSVTPYTNDYGVFRIPSMNNTMPGRSFFAAAIDPHAAVIYMSGGQSDDISSNDALADVWSFNISSKLFTWIGGTTTVGDAAPGTYPTLRGMSGGEVHAARPSNYGANMWLDPSGGLWFGMGIHANWRREEDMFCNGEDGQLFDRRKSCSQDDNYCV